MSEVSEGFLGAVASELCLKDGGELDRGERWPGCAGRGNLMSKGLEMGTDECVGSDSKGKGIGAVSWLCITSGQ